MHYLNQLWPFGFTGAMYSCTCVQRDMKKERGGCERKKKKNSNSPHNLPLATATTAAAVCFAVKTERVAWLPPPSPASPLARLLFFTCVLCLPAFSTCVCFGLSASLCGASCQGTHRLTTPLGRRKEECGSVKTIWESFQHPFTLITPHSQITNTSWSSRRICSTNAEAWAEALCEMFCTVCNVCYIEYRQIFEILGETLHYCIIYAIVCWALCLRVCYTLWFILSYEI